MALLLTSPPPPLPLRASLTLSAACKRCHIHSYRRCCKSKQTFAPTTPTKSQDYFKLLQFSADCHSSKQITSCGLGSPALSPTAFCAFRPASLALPFSLSPACQHFQKKSIRSSPTQLKLFRNAQFNDSRHKQRASYVFVNVLMVTFYTAKALSECPV